MIVLSSTSSSERETLPAGWLATWGRTAVLVAVMLAGWVVFGPLKGRSHPVNDDARRWAATRQQAGSDSVVLVGTSRMEADVQPTVFAQVTGRKTIQLGISGGLSYLVLESLA